MVRLGVSPKVLTDLKKLFKTVNRPIPLIKYKIPEKLRPGDIISLKSTPTSMRVKVVSIREFDVDRDPIPYDELKTVYNDVKLKVIFSSAKVKKFYLVYIRPID